MPQIDPKERVSEGVNRARLSQEARRSVGPAIVFGLGLVLMAGILLWFAHQIEPSFGKKTHEVRFAVNNVFGVFEGFDEVRYRGVPAGTIEKIERDGDQPVLVAKIESQYGPIYRNAQAELRPQTPLNDMYLDITNPGTPNAGEATSSDTLPENQTTTMVTVPDVLDTFGKSEQQNLYTLLDQLGNGTADGGKRLQQAFVELLPFLKAAHTLTQQIDYRRAAMKRVIHNTALLTTELGNRDDQLKNLVAQGSATFGALHDESGNLDATLAELGPTFTQIRSTLDSVNGVVDDVDTGLKSLYPVADRLGPALGDIRALNDTLGPAVRDLRHPVQHLVPLAQNLLPASVDLNDSFKSLLPQIPTVNKVFRDAASCQNGVIGFFQWNSSLAKFGDSLSLVPRGNLGWGFPEPGVPGEPLRQYDGRSCTPGPIQSHVATLKDMH